MQAVAERQAEADERVGLIAAAAALPDAREPLLRLAGLSEIRRDWPTAEWCWRRFVLLDEAFWLGHVKLAEALSGQGRTEAAEATLDLARTRFPHEPAVAAAYARSAAGRGAWAEALARWEHALAACPDHPDAACGAASALRHLGRPEEARAVLTAAFARAPADQGLLHDLGRLAEAGRDWPLAERLWRAFLESAQPPWAYVALARARFGQDDREGARAILGAHLEGVLRSGPDEVGEAILLLGEHLDAAALPLIAACERALDGRDLSGSLGARLGYAQAAKNRADYAAYLARAEATAERFPGDLRARMALAEAQELAPFGARPAAASSGPGSDFGRFESLGGGGDRGGCEFGFLQRKHGFEPLSLLRWATIEPDRLAEALERRFEGLGEPGTVRIEEQGHYDWRAVDTVYGIRMDHTHLDRQSVSREAAERQVVTRLRYLARKLIDDLAEADKVFVYRMAGAGVDRELLLRLSRAMATYGDALLTVVCEDGASWRTEFFDVAPNLLVAAHESFSMPRWRTLEEAEPSWREVCARSLERMPDREDVAQMPLRELALRFESLGGGSLNESGWAFGCEFGFFQRHCKVEPLGLLRWASIAPDDLIAALSHDFIGMDDPEQLLMHMNHDGTEWGFRQLTYRAWYDHTGLDPRETSEASAKRKVARGFSLLRRKMLEDLAAGDKVFVYRCYDHRLTDETLDRLLAALARHGDATLLYVAKVSDGAAPLTVERRGRRMLYGWIDRFAPLGDGFLFNDPGWEAICRAALRVMPRGRASAPQPDAQPVSVRA